MKRDTRDKIIETASELFYRNGYNLTGINEIIKESGIAKATLYSHFQTKEELLLAYLDAKDSELLSKIDSFISTKPRGNDRIVAVLQFLLPFFNQENFNGCWCIRTVAEVPRENDRIRSKIKDNKVQFRKFLSDVVSDNKPELSNQQQGYLTDQLYILYEGAITESHIHASDWPIVTSIDILKDKLDRI